MCRNIEDAACGTELTCGNGIDCDTKYVRARACLCGRMRAGAWIFCGWESLGSAFFLNAPAQFSFFLADSSGANGLATLFHVRDAGVHRAHHTVNPCRMRVLLLGGPWWCRVVPRPRSITAPFAGQCAHGALTRFAAAARAVFRWPLQVLVGPRQRPYIPYVRGVDGRGV